ncbi:MAG: PDZ domain-containing protein [bacterium]
MRRVLAFLLVGLVAAGCGFFRSAGKKEESLMPEGRYLVVTSVVEGSEAARVGVKEGDIILSYDGNAVSSVAQLNELKQTVKTEMVELAVLRKEKKKVFKIKKGQIGVYLAERRPEVELADDAVVLEGVGKLGWETGMSNSFIGAVAAIAEYLKLNKDYTYLMGVSGTAPRIHFHKDWCPSSPDPTVGFDTGSLALSALGLDYECHHLDTADPAAGEMKEAVRKLIMESINAGKPVIAIDLIEVPEWGVITGYQNGGSEFLCRTYFDKQEGYSIAEKFPWAVVVLKDRKQAPSDMENYKNGLQVALKVATVDSFGDYYSGTEALKRWIHRLKMDNFADMDSAKFQDVWLANAWIYQRLADDRTHAYAFLDGLAERFPVFKEKLAGLSEVYKVQVEILKKAARSVPFPFAVAPGETWTGDMRAKEVDALEDVLEKEYEAVDILKDINTRI